jgi:hypothetical protein
MLSNLELLNIIEKSTLVKEHPNVLCDALPVPRSRYPNSSFPGANYSSYLTIPLALSLSLKPQHYTAALPEPSHTP